MKIECYGKVQSRTMRKTEKGELYTLVVEEPGRYPSPFAFATREASVFGPKDGPCGVGKYVKAYGFANGVKREIERKDGSGKFTKYEIYFTLSRIEAASAPEFSDTAAAPAAGDLEDIPF